MRKAAAGAVGLSAGAGCSFVSLSAARTHEARFAAGGGASVQGAPEVASQAPLAGLQRRRGNQSAARSWSTLQRGYGRPPWLRRRAPTERRAVMQSGLAAHIPSRSEHNPCPNVFEFRPQAMLLPVNQCVFDCTFKASFWQQTSTHRAAAGQQRGRQACQQYAALQAQHAAQTGASRLKLMPAAVTAVPAVAAAACRLPTAQACLLSSTPSRLWA